MIFSKTFPNIFPSVKRRTVVIFLISFLFIGPIGEAFGQKKNAVFQTGERLTYKVKFGFVKLGTLIMETGAPAAGNRVNARMKFWTAQVPFLDSKDVVDDIIDTSAVCLMRFEEHGHDGSKKMERTFTYDPVKREISYSDATVQNRIISDVRPFSDAVALFFNLRAWNGSGGKYFFPLRGHEGEKIVNCYFSKNEKEQECPAFEDKEIQTYVVEGRAEMGDSAPLGASGKFTAFITKDEASIPIRIDMKIAIGSISLILDKVERTGWQP
ncbi:MAG: DUF3108 domain-containing protein [Bacteroidota bacterium]|nr:DUF3108 domain-containing protein [Bacteroidota bacterium]MDP4229447.1 DUF3108 domain-containing protein [Bacteroidota bacterium]MDP4235398.1 DUF3108 domain-containing protein [Bacteroidota bacterium]